LTPFDDIDPSVYSGIREYDAELDDGSSVIADICEVFENTDNIRFIVSGFCNDPWPVDCRVDLPVIIEQLPDILRKMNEDDFNFILDFYEQGIEREINFKSNHDNVILECISRNNWVPKPNIIIMSKDEVKQMIDKFYKEFLSISKFVCDDLSENQMLRDCMKICWRS
jgi:hypothetical protein